MPRRVEIVVVPEWGERDKGKKFEIREAPALQAEKWFWRLVIALKGTAGEIPQEVASFGIVGVAIRGVNTFLAADVDFAKLDPLLDELMTCVKFVRDASVADKTTGRPLATLITADDIEEIKTIAWLRSEVLRIHTNFSLADGLMKLVTSVMNPLPASPPT